MPTHQEVWTWARKFRREYGKTLANHLKYWNEGLGIGRERMLRLLGFGPRDVERLRGASWEVIADEAGESGWLVDGLLVDLISRYSYNLHVLASELRGNSRDGANVTTRRATGLVESLAFLPPEERERILFNQIAAGGPQALSALVDYLFRS